MASRQIAWAEKQPQLEYIGDITSEELAKHNTKEDCWCSYKGYVYNLTPYISIHPGGEKIILKFAGGDMTNAYDGQHAYVSITLLDKVKIGKLI